MSLTYINKVEFTEVFPYITFQLLKYDSFKNHFVAFLQLLLCLFCL